MLHELLLIATHNRRLSKLRARIGSAGPLADVTIESEIEDAERTVKGIEDGLLKEKSDNTEVQDYFRKKGVIL